MMEVALDWLEKSFWRGIFAGEPTFAQDNNQAEIFAGNICRKYLEEYLQRTNHQQTYAQDNNQTEIFAGIFAENQPPANFCTR